MKKNTKKQLKVKTTLKSGGSYQECMAEFNDELFCYDGF